MKYVRIVLSVTVLLGMTGWSMVLYADTIVEWWIVPAMALAAGLATGLHMWRMWRWLTRKDAMWINYLCHSVFTSAFLTCLFFALNTACSDRAGWHQEAGLVKGHYRVEHQRTRRVGRRYVASGEKYYEYKLLIELADGQSKMVTVNDRRYRSVRNGDSLTVPVTDGLLGLTVIRADSIKFVTRKKPAVQRRKPRISGRRG